jgi:GT2 family glycosyltransferase
MITALLNGFRRTENLDQQIAALRCQSIEPEEIMIWHNHPGDGRDFNFAVSSQSKSAFCNSNLGVWARFAYALNAKTEFVCVFDDDTFPGPRWFENCLSTLSRQDALLGTIGLLYTDPPPAASPQCSYYTPYLKIGWEAGGNNEMAMEVDLVGHAWFFRRAWLSTFWRELPDPKFTLCGEDMHFSYMLQKYLGIPTLVPPHPRDNRALWGSTEGKRGNDQHSLYANNVVDSTGTPFRSAMDHFFIQQRRKGWRLVNDR